ncbi:hypothetical protein DHEL01_v206070 [Diaporthe helianthi]|uniref:Uncharacterized protein n=1 Tax=Diaporthe helianthi TaxID=158607 RepID=A0A2P5HZ72_DIAHE|nr:hypothetical protein DHEL01_v206070 [Diaporthe helianthi]
MANCPFPVNSGAYGIGIRLAFYLQWFGMTITAWAPGSETLKLLNFINVLTTAATSIGLVMNLETLQPVEIYIVLLLTSGTLYFTIPTYLWRLVTCCRPWWDPERWTRIKTGWLFRVSTYSMYGALLSLHIWFWCQGVHVKRKSGPDVDSDREPECEQYGFLFAQLRLDDPGLVTLNIIIHLSMLLVGTGIFANRTGIFEHFRSIRDLIVASIVTLAVELVISWNQITGANDLNSAAQLIPPVTTGAFLVHGLCVWAAGPDSDGEASGRYYCPRATRTSRRRRRPSHRRRRSWRSRTELSDFLDAYPDLFDLPPELFLQTPPVSLGSHAGRHPSRRYNTASDHYGMQYDDYFDHDGLYL